MKNNPDVNQIVIEADAALKQAMALTGLPFGEALHSALKVYINAVVNKAMAEIAETISEAKRDLEDQINQSGIYDPHY